MAIEILQYLVDAQLPGSAPAPVVHATHHDLESLVYVVVYAAYRAVYKKCKAPNTEITPADHQLFMADFEKFFGNVSAVSVLDARKAMITRMDGGSGKPPQDNVFRHLPVAINTICSMLLPRVKRQHPDFTRATITQEIANVPEMEDILQEFADELAIVGAKPPVTYLTCQDTQHLVDTYVTAFSRKLQGALAAA